MPRTRCSCPTSPRTQSGAFKKVTEPGTAAAQPKLWVFTRVQGEDEGEGAGSRSRLQEGNSAWGAAGVVAAAAGQEITPIQSSQPHIRAVRHRIRPD